MLADAFRKICGYTPEAALLVRPDGLIESANEAAGELLGVDSRALAGQNLLDRAEDRTALEGYLKLALRNRELVPGACKLKTPAGVLDCYVSGGLAGREGPHRYLLLRVASKADTTDRFRVLNDHVRALHGEITERKRVELQIAAHREWLRTTLASIGDGVIVTDSAGQITFMNPVAEHLTGWSFEEAGKRRLQQVFNIYDETSRLPVENPLDRVLREGVVAGLANHTLLVRRDGSEIPIDDSGSPIRDPDGSVSGAVLVFRDVTERRRSENDLRTSNRRLKHANDSLKQFAYAAAHDLKEPLRTVSIYAEMLEKRYREKMDGRAGQYLQFVRESAGRMQMLVDDLFSFTQSSDVMESQPEPVDCGEVLESVLAGLAGVIAETQSIVRASRLPIVEAHRVAVVQLLRNLILNAIQYRKPGTSARIDVGAERIGAWFKMFVRDDGIGIDPQYHRHIFGLFKRLDRASPGTGVGLAVCERIVEHYGGRIWVDSRHGEGSCFFFTLPASAEARTEAGSSVT